MLVFYRALPALDPLCLAWGRKLPSYQGDLAEDVILDHAQRSFDRECYASPEGFYRNGRLAKTAALTPPCHNSATVHMSAPCITLKLFLLT